MASNFKTERQTHYLALVLGIFLVVLIAMAFVTFAFGAYAVFDQPNSNVVAETVKTSSGATLIIQGANFQNNSLREVWIDPQISVDDSGNPTSLYVGSAWNWIGNVTTDAYGNVNASINIPESILNKIQTDGQNPHEVWIVGATSVLGNGSSTFLNLTTDSQENYTAASTGQGIYFFVMLIVLSLPVNFNLGQLFIVLWTIYLLLFVVALNGPFRNIIGSLKDTARKGLNGLLSNSAFAMFLVFPVVLWGSVLLAALQQSAGVPTGSLPPTDPLLEFVELALAPLREEIGFRVIPIGVVALLILFSKRRVRDGILALWHPSRYLKKVDSPGEYRNHQIVMYILIAISAALFGAAHVLFGAGWDIGKVSQAAAAGVALGVLYYQYGFAATVLLHWAIDYMIDAYTTNAIFLNVFTYVEIFTMAVAIMSTIALVVLLVRRLKRQTPSIGLNPRI